MKHFSLQPQEVHALSTKHRKNTFTFLFAAYYYALQEYVKNNKIEFDKQAQIYSAPPLDVITWMLRVLGKFLKVKFKLDALF